VIKIDNVKLKFQKALQYHQSGRIPEAQALYRIIIKENPKHFDSCHLLGVSLIQSGFNREGISMLLRAIELKPTSAEAYYNLAHGWQSLRDFEAALSSLERAIALRHNDPEYYFERGNVLKQLNRPKEAIVSYEKAVQLQPNYFKVYNNLGILQKEIGEPERAVNSYDKAISLKPDYAEAFYNRGNTLKELDRLDEALASYNEAISLKPDYAEAFYNRGNTLNELDRLDEALASYDKAISLKPDYAKVFYNRGTTLKELDRFDEAMASYDKAISLKPDYAQAYCGRGWLYYRIEEWTSASVNFDAALNHEPTSNSAMSGLSLLPPGVVSPDKIRDCLEVEATEWKDRADYLFTRANLLSSLGNYAKAFDALEKANQKRVTDGNLNSQSWKENFDRISMELISWKPIQLQNSSSHQKLLVILGPSRSGKTTLERMLSNNSSFFRGFEGCRASQAVESIRGLAEEIRQHSTYKNDSYLTLNKFLFPAYVEALAQQEYRLYTITNPHLLPAVPAMADIHGGAYFIFVSRNSIDNAAEIFAKDYSDQPSYAYQAATALDYVERYNETAKQLARKLGSRALEVKFDEVVQRPEKILNDIYSFVELEPPSSIPDKLLARQNLSPASLFREKFAKLLAC
jgi:tetratricopeptide (TPR) repeat protein